MNQIKDFFDYIFNSFKIFVILQPWEVGIRVRNGKNVKQLEGGLYFKIPYFDSVYIQEKRLRIVSIPMQTITDETGRCITISGAFGYSVFDVYKLFQTISHPDTAIVNMVMSKVAEIILNNKDKNLKPKDIEDSILKNFSEIDYGLKVEYYKIANFAVVRTYRLIQDGSYFYEENNMAKHK